MLNIISLGLFDKKDVSIKGLELIKKCDILFLERYTNFLGSSTTDLEGFFEKKITELKREDLENKSKKIIEKAKKEDIGILVSGDCFSATTHISLLIEARKENVKTNIIHGSSILTAIGESGLSLYNFGKTTTIPFDNENIKSPIEALKNNLRSEMHTLFLLDVKGMKYMNIKEGLRYLIKNKIKEDTFCVCFCALGSEDKKIKFGKIKDLIGYEFKSYPQCFAIPGKLHFMEEEALENYK